MIKTKVYYLRKEFVVEEEEPSTIPELAALIGEDAIITNTNANLRYRNKYIRVYKRVSVEVAKLGFPPPVKKIVDDKPVYVDEIEHISAYLAADPVRRLVLQELFERIAKEEPLYVKGDRVGGGGRIAQGALDAAHRYFAEGPEKVGEVVEKIEEMIPSYRINRVGNGEVTPETLARGIQTLQRHLLSKSKQTVKSL